MNNNKDKALIKLIIIILVGYLGIHKFMEKKTTLGLIYLFTFGLCGIGWIIDIIIAVKDFNEINNKVNANCNIASERKSNVAHTVNLKKLTLDEIVDINPNEYIVFDTETTGLHPYSGDKIIEFSLLKYKDGKLIDKFVSLVNPGCQLPVIIIELTGINDNDLIDKPQISSYIIKIINFINNGIIIGHNIPFDIDFLKCEIDRCNFDTPELNVEYIDTLDMVKKTIYDIDNNKLETLKKYFGIQTSSHRAEADCETTNEVYKRCLELLIEKKNHDKKMAENYKKREEERLLNMSDDEREIINYFIEVAKKHDKEITYSFKSDKAISFTLCGIEIGRIKFNGKKRYCRLFAGDSKKHIWENVENPEKKQILEYIDDLFVYVDKEYKRYFLEYGD